jgi:pilus assembly protein TadC
MEPRKISGVALGIPTMRRSASDRPTFPFLGLALLLAVAAAVCGAFLKAELTAVFLAALALISFHLGTPAPRPIRIHARGNDSRR